MKYTYSDILSKIDHTLLKPTATLPEIYQLCDEAVEYQTASVCIPPAFIARVRAAYPNLNICTVVGFPNGYNTTESKVFETRDAIEKGANEIDMVINLGFVMDCDYDAVLDEIRQIKAVCGERILKVIIETAYLNTEQIIKLCEIVSESGADYIKTSTGFASRGASFRDIELFARHISSGVEMKAAGGMKTYDDLVKYLNLGCMRLGTSSGLELVLQRKKEEEYWWWTHNRQNKK